MKITIYGSGYVGLVTGACMAQVGNDVLCIDCDVEKVARLSKGEVATHEPSLDDMIIDNINAGRLNFSSSAQLGVEHGLYQFIAVNVPTDDEGTADLKHVLEVAQSIAEHMTAYRIIIGKSTVPVGTGDKVSAKITDVLQKHSAKVEFDIVSNPEFIKVGAAIDDFMKPDRIIIGCENPRTTELMRELYAPFNHNRDRLVTMDVKSAEMTKYAANALLATKISFMNELSNMTEILGADIEQVRIGIGSDPRIGYHFIYPGCGYGGSRFPKDVRTLIRTATDIGYNAELLRAVEAVNYRQKEKLFEKLVHHYGDSLKNKTITIWGLSFKPNTSDMRGSASRVLMKYLWNIGAKVNAYDPAANKVCAELYGEREDLAICSSAETALEGADALVIVTDWQEFRSPDMDIILSTLNDPVIIDGRNLYNPEHMKELGITYYGIGRGEQSKK